MKCILTQQARGGSSSSSYTLQELEITSAPTKTEYLAGDSFDKTGMQVMATYGVDGIPMNQVDVTNSVTITPDPLVDGTSRIKVSMRASNGKEVAAYYPVTVIHKLISISSPQLANSYEYGDTISNPVKATAQYSDGTSASVNGTSNITSLTQLGTVNVTISYSENGVSVTTVASVAVEKKSVPKPTWKGNAITYSGSVVNVNNATYWNNFDTTYYTMSGYSGTDAGEYTAIFTLGSYYRWDDKSEEALRVAWNISKRPISTVPTQSGTLTYNGSSQSPTWNNYDSNQLTIGGQTSGTDAGSYTVTFTPTNNYVWSDGSESKDVDWVIGKASRTLKLTPSSVSFDASNYNSYQTVVVDYPHTDSNYDYTSLDGTSITPTISSIDIRSSSVLMGLRIKGDGVTEISNGKITVTINEDSNYLKCSADITVNAEYDWWGDDDALEDTAWWGKLCAKLLTMTKEQKQKCLGRTKKIKMASRSSGDYPWNSEDEYIVMCVGYDVEAENSLTFQTKDLLSNYVIFGTSGAYSTSEVKNSLSTFISSIATPNFSTNSIIPSIRKISWENYDSEILTSSDKKIYSVNSWLPSLFEMGIGTSGDGTDGMPSQAYQYYTSNESRKKYIYNNSRLSIYCTRTRVKEGDKAQIYTINGEGTNQKNTVGPSTYLRIAPCFTVKGNSNWFEMD